MQKISKLKQPLWWMPVLVLALGCTTAVTVPRNQMRPGVTLSKAEVFLAGGARYAFRRVSFRPDSLIGEYTVAVERRAAGEGMYYDDEVRLVTIPLTRIDSLTVIRKDPGKTLLYGAGLGAVVALISNMADRSVTSSSNGSGGIQTKPPPQMR
jgi:hypothetical protein